MTQEEITMTQGSPSAVTDEPTYRRMASDVGGHALALIDDPDDETPHLPPPPPPESGLRRTNNSAPKPTARRQPRRHTRRFSVLVSTEQNHKSDDMEFYGPYAHIRKTLDYDYHCNYKKERQWLQDSIIEEMLDSVKLTDVNGDVCTTPTEPWIVFTAGAMGAGKSYTINRLVQKGRFPLLAFVLVDPDEIRRHLPEFMVYAQQFPELAGQLTRKEAGYIAEILTLAALQAGKNVLVDGSLRDADWYKGYFQRLKKEYTSLKIAILHITAPREAVFQRAAKRAKQTGRVVPQRVLEQALEQVPRSVEILSPLVDYFCELRNSPDTDDIEIVTEGETWDSFQKQWLQTCAWVPGKRKESYLRRAQKAVAQTYKEEENLENISFSSDEKKEASEFAMKAAAPRRVHYRSFSVLLSTEMNHRSNDMEFYGPYSHIRSTLDYTYHFNYKKERQWLQDAIITDTLKDVEITDVNGDVCTTPTEPWLVFTAGAMGAGKSHTINVLVKKNRFPLLAFVQVDPDEIRRHLPEYDIYVDQCPVLAGELTRKEAGYVAEILTLAALQAGKNVLVDGSLRDCDWYQGYFKRLRDEYKNLQIAILHVTAPRDAVFQRAAHRALETGRVVPEKTLVMALEQVPKSVRVLAPLADYSCELHNPPKADDVELRSDGETWEIFQQKWLQTCAWIPRRKKKAILSKTEEKPTKENFALA